jgi:hypothetical protein
MKHAAARFATWLALWPAALVAAQAESYVIVHPTNPIKALTQKEAVDLFMGKTRNFPNGDFALAFDLPRDSPVRAAFYQALTGQGVAQVNSYWARLMFTGQTLPPQPVPDEAAMAELVKRNPSAIGYLSREPADRGLRVVLVLKDGH